MPERQHAGLFRRQIARTENRIGTPIQQGTQQLHVFRWIIFQIRILYQTKITLRVFDRRAHRRALPLIHRVTDQPDAGVAGRQFFQNRAGPVSGAIVDDHQLALHIFGQRSGQYQRQAALHHRALVVNRNQDRKTHGGIPQYKCPAESPVY